MPFVQFKDEKKTEVVATFGCEQDPEAWPYVEEVDASDPRYAVYFESLPVGAREGIPTPT